MVASPGGDFFSFFSFDFSFFFPFFFSSLADDLGALEEEAIALAWTSAVVRLLRSMTRLTTMSRESLVGSSKPSRKDDLRNSNPSGRRRRMSSANCQSGKVNPERAILDHWERWEAICSSMQTSGLNRSSIRLPQSIAAVTPSFFLYLVARCDHTSAAVGGSVEVVVVPATVVETRYSSMWSWSSSVQVDPIKPRALEFAFLQTFMAAVSSSVGVLMLVTLG